MSVFASEPDEPPLKAREARKVDTIQRRLLRQHSPGVWEKLKLNLTKAVCQSCSRSLYGFPTNATTCSPVCRCRHHRKRHGAGTPERRLNQLDALDMKRLEDDDDGLHIPGVKVYTGADMLNDQAASLGLSDFRASDREDDGPKVRPRQSAYGFASAVRCVQCGAREKCGHGASRRKPPVWDSGMAAAPQRSVDGTEDGGPPKVVPGDPFWGRVSTIGAELIHRHTSPPEAPVIPEAPDAQPSTRPPARASTPTLRARYRQDDIRICALDHGGYSLPLSKLRPDHRELEHQEKSMIQPLPTEQRLAADAVRLATISTELAEIAGRVAERFPDCEDIAAGVERFLATAVPKD